MTKTTIPFFHTAIDVLKEDKLPGMRKDFVEIEPVIVSDENITPIFEEKHRSASFADVLGPGYLNFKENPDHVPGAYENLQHHKARPALRDLGLEFDVGVTYLVPLDAAPLMHGSYDVETDANGNLARGLEAMAFSEAVILAAKAAKRNGGTHVRIQIR